MVGVLAEPRITHIDATFPKQMLHVRVNPSFVPTLKVEGAVVELQLDYA